MDDYRDINRMSDNRVINGVEHEVFCIFGKNSKCSGQPKHVHGKLAKVANNGVANNGQKDRRYHETFQCMILEKFLPHATLSRLLCFFPSFEKVSSFQTELPSQTLSHAFPIFQSFKQFLLEVIDVLLLLLYLLRSGYLANLGLEVLAYGSFRRKQTFSNVFSQRIYVRQNPSS